MKNYNLTEAEQQRLKDVSSRAVPGLYRVKDLLGEKTWASIASKRSYGIRAKRSVEEGDIPEMWPYGKTVENHQIYAVKRPRANEPHNRKQRKAK